MKALAFLLLALAAPLCAQPHAGNAEAREPYRGDPGMPFPDGPKSRN